MSFYKNVFHVIGINIIIQLSLLYLNKVVNFLVRALSFQFIGEFIHDMNFGGYSAIADSTFILYEKSGQLSGLMLVPMMQMNDIHIHLYVC